MDLSLGERVKGWRPRSEDSGVRSEGFVICASRRGEGEGGDRSRFLSLRLLDATEYCRASLSLTRAGSSSLLGSWEDSEDSERRSLGENLRRSGGRVSLSDCKKVSGCWDMLLLLRIPCWSVMNSRDAPMDSLALLTLPRFRGMSGSLSLRDGCS